MSEENILKKKRLEKSLTLDDVEKILKIRKRHLKALEEEDYTNTPGITYAIGYLRAYGALLELTDEEKKEIINKINQAFSKKGKGQATPEKEIIPLNEEDEKPKKEPKRKQEQYISPSKFKKTSILVSIIVLIGVLGFFGFKLLTQSEEFSFKKTGVYTPYIKVTVRNSKSNIKKNVKSTPKPTEGEQTPVVTQTPFATPTFTPLPKIMAKYNMKIVPKNDGWVRVYTKNGILFEGIMLKGREYIFKSENPITMVVEDSKLFSVYAKDKPITIPEGSFVKYTFGNEKTEENG